MERCNAGLSFWIVRSCVHKHADPPLGLLRSRGKRPSSRYTADKRDEIASPHWLPLQQRVLPYHGDRRIVHHGKFGQPMSAMGQKQTSRHLQRMSALPPKADIRRHDWNVRFVPQADSCTAAKPRQEKLVMLPPVALVASFKLIF